MRQVFDVMFVLSLVLPPAAVLAGALALAWPKHVRKEPAHAGHPAHA